MTPTTDKPAAPASAAELIGRYVHEVARRLPPAQRDDVSRELRSSLLDALEDRFGPEPTWVQAAVLLRETGPPRQIAASYRPADQYLIGPEWFPAFTRVLRIVLTAYLAVLVGACAVSLVFRGGDGLSGVVFGLLGGSLEGGLAIFAIVVAIFHLLQRTEKPPRPADEWDPEELPAARASDLVGRGEAVLEIVLPAAFLALLYAFRDSLGVTVTGADGPPLLNDLFHAYLPWLSAVVVAEMALGVLLVWRGRWTWPTRAVKLAIDLAALALFWRLAADVTARRPDLVAAGVPDVAADLVVQIAWSVPVVIALVVVVGLVKRVVRTVRETD